MNSSASRIAFIGNPASISWLIGRELRTRGYDVDIIAEYNKFRTQDTRQKKPNILHRAIRKYCKPLYHLSINRKEYDVELRAFSSPIVKARHRAVIYHGTDLRDHLWPV